MAKSGVPGADGAQGDEGCDVEESASERGGVMTEIVIEDSDGEENAHGNNEEAQAI